MCIIGRSVEELLMDEKFDGLPVVVGRGGRGDWNASFVLIEQHLYQDARVFGRPIKHNLQVGA